MSDFIVDEDELKDDSNDFFGEEQKEPEKSEETKESEKDVLPNSKKVGHLFSNKKYFYENDYEPYNNEADIYKNECGETIGFRPICKKKKVYPPCKPVKPYCKPVKPCCRPKAYFSDSYVPKKKLRYFPFKIEEKMCESYSNCKMNSCDIPKKTFYILREPGQNEDGIGEDGTNPCYYFKKSHKSDPCGAILYVKTPILNC